MASTLDFALVREPQLLDLIDDEWAQDCLPDDGEPPANLFAQQTLLLLLLLAGVALRCSVRQY